MSFALMRRGVTGRAINSEIECVMLSTTARDQSIWPSREKPVQQNEVDHVPNSGVLPIAYTPPTSHAGAAAQFFRHHPPRDAPSEYEQNASEISPVAYTGSATLRAWAGKLGGAVRSNTT